MMHISQIVRKWRGSGQEGQSTKPSCSSFGKVVYEILAIYEKDIESTRKQLPAFIGTLQEVKAVVKDTAAKVEVKKKPVAEKEAPVKTKTIEPESKDDDWDHEPESKDDDWDHEMSDFTQGLYEDKENDFWTQENKEEEVKEAEKNIQKNEENEENEEEEEEDEAPPELREDFFVPEEPEPVNLEKLLQSMKEDETGAKGEKDPSKNKGPFHRIKRKRGNIDRKKKRKKNDWQDPKKNK